MSPNEKNGDSPKQQKASEKRSAVFRDIVLILCIVMGFNILLILSSSYKLNLEHLDFLKLPNLKTFHSFGQDSGQEREQMVTLEQEEAEKTAKPFSEALVSGTTNVNLINGGIVAQDSDGWIYYSDVDSMKRDTADTVLHYAFFKMRADGTEKIRLSDEAAGFINIQDSWVYYSNISDGYKLYRMRSDGTQKKKLNDHSCRYVAVRGDWIYYVNSNDQGIYRMNLDGSRQTKLANEKSPYITVAGGWIYYCNGSDYYTLYQMKIDGTHKKKIIDKSFMSQFVIAGDGVLFIDGDRLFRIKIDGTGLHSLSKKNEISYYKPVFLPSEPYMYYLGGTGSEKDARNLYRVNGDGTNRMKISDAQCYQVNLLGNELYYTTKEGMRRLKITS